MEDIHVITPLPKARRDEVFNRGVFERTEILYPNPTQTYKARRMQYKISGALCQGTFWNSFLVYLIFF